MKKSLKPLNAPPPKLSSPWKSALHTATHAVALGGLLVGGAVWTISQQHPLYANPGKLLKLPAAVQSRGRLSRRVQPCPGKQRGG